MTRSIDVADITFVVLKEHVDGFHIVDEIRRFYPDAKTVVLPHVLDGACLSCLEGVKWITDDCPILFNDCDHMFFCKQFDEFCSIGRFGGLEGPDGAILTFESNEPRYSFLEYDDAGHVVRTVEKDAVSSHAICGAYYFKNRAVFERATDKYLKECDYSEYFMSGVYNVLARENGVVLGFQTDAHIPFGTPEEYHEAIGNRYFRLMEEGMG